jgi:hypothetical protein
MPRLQKIRSRRLKCVLPPAAELHSFGPALIEEIQSSAPTAVSGAEFGAGKLVQFNFLFSSEERVALDPLWRMIFGIRAKRFKEI